MVRRSKLEKPNTHFWLFNSLILIFYFFANEAQAATGPNRSLKLQNEVHFLRFSKVISFVITYLFVSNITAYFLLKQDWKGSQLHSKPSLKIGKASAIFWIYLAIFRDYG